MHSSTLLAVIRLTFSFVSNIKFFLQTPVASNVFTSYLLVIIEVHAVVQSTQISFGWGNIQ